MDNLPQVVVELIESGVSILVGTRDEKLRPATVRGVGARVDANRRQVTVFLPDATAGRAIRNLKSNGQIAVGFSRSYDHFSVQIKGRCTSVRLANKDERKFPAQYAIAFVENMYTVGLPRAVIKRLHHWPAWSVTFDVSDVFSQSPGPGAGKPWSTP
jgi:hypothetical protein